MRISTLKNNIPHGMLIEFDISSTLYTHAKTFINRHFQSLIPIILKYYCLYYYFKKNILTKGMIFEIIKQ